MNIFQMITLEHTDTVGYIIAGLLFLFAIGYGLYQYLTSKKKPTINNEP